MNHAVPSALEGCFAVSVSWEQEALYFVKTSFPDIEPYRAWLNFEFVSPDGFINEVDLLALTPQGLFLIEIKSAPGTVTGDAGTWTWRSPEGKIRTDDNPLILANRKANRLASLLKAQKAFQKTRCPFVEPILFLSHPDADCRLSAEGQTHVVLRDRKGEPGKPDRQGVIAAIKFRKAPGLEQNIQKIDSTIASALSRAMEEAGIRPSRKHRRVGDYELDEVLAQCPKDTYQDWSAHHVSIKNSLRRIRIYNYVIQADSEIKKQIQAAASREYALLEQLNHPGVLRVDTLTETERGPALIFRYDERAERLDHYIIARGTKLFVDTRLHLVQSVAEALHYAHSKKVVYRALCPQSILVVNPDSLTPEIRIFNWHTGARSSITSTRTQNSATIDAEQFLDDASLLYSAPETWNDQGSRQVTADIFSLGTVTYFIFAGSPPSTTLNGLSELLQQSGGLDLSLACESVPESLRQLIFDSTRFDPTQRLSGLYDFKVFLDCVLEELTSPVPASTQTNPTLANKDDVLAGGILVKKRLGSGSCAVVFLVEHEGKEKVLKIANDPKQTARILGEAETIKGLTHSNIVAFQGNVPIRW